MISVSTISMALLLIYCGIKNNVTMNKNNIEPLKIQSEKARKFLDLRA